MALTLIFSQVLTRWFPGLATGHSRLGLIFTELREMSTTYRRRLDVVLGAAALSVLHSRNERPGLLPGGLDCFFQPCHDTGPAFLDGPLTLFTMAVPLPFGALGLSEEVGQQLFKLVGHPSGALAMMGFRVLMYAGGLLGACVYLWKLKEVRSLTASAHQIEEELLDGDGDELAGIGAPRVKKAPRSRRRSID